jgi:hypothetical protein
MLVTLAIWLYTGCLAYIYGFVLFTALKRLQPSSSGNVPGPAIIMLLGLTAVSVLAGFTSLFIKIGLAANVIILAGAVVLAIILQRGLIATLRANMALLRTIHPLAWAIFIFMLLFAVLLTPSVPANYDTGLYHAQAIRWIEEYPAVPGLGNLFRNLTFISTWFTASAFTSFSFLGGQSYHVLGGFLFVLFALFGSEKISALLRGKITVSGLSAAGGLFFARWFFGTEISSPGTDLPAGFLCWIIFILAIEFLEDPSVRDRGWQIGTILILAVFSITIKLSLVPILLIPVFLIVFTRKQWGPRKLLAAGFLALLIMIPWTARSVIQSGYLTYPVYQVDLFAFDWKMPAEYVQEDVEWIYSWPRMPGADKDEVLKMGIRDWLPGWYASQTRNDRYLLFALAAGAGIFILTTLVQVARKEAAWKTTRILIPLYFIAAAGVAYWFLQAPAFRFGYGFIGSALCILFAPAAVWLLTRNRQVGLAGAASILALLILYYGQGTYKQLRASGLREIAVIPRDYPVVELRTEKLGNFEVSMPVQLDQCWYTPLPCTPMHNPEVNLRRTSLADGFFNKH